MFMNQTLTYVKYLPHVNFPMGLMLICTGANLYPYIQILFIFFQTKLVPVHNLLNSFIVC